MINLIKCSAISRVLIFTLFRHQGCGDQSGNGPGSVCSKLSLCLRNGSLNATGAGHQGNQGKPVAELCGHRLNQLEDLASHSAHQLLLCAFPASDTGEKDLKRFLLLSIVFIWSILGQYCSTLTWRPKATRLMSQCSGGQPCSSLLEYLPCCQN